MTSLPPGPERKLAAILAADVVGFSRLMGADEVGTLRRFNAARREVIEPLVAAGGGRVFKVIGDGLLIEFGSVVQALRAAVAVQARLWAHAAELPAERRLLFRMGMHQGDVLVEGDDLLGEGVNIAARLEQLAPPGGICLSARVREDAAGKLPLAVLDGGECRLKNIVLPVRVFYALPGRDEAAPSLAGLVRTLVAVAPFASQGGAEAASLAASLPAGLVAALAGRPGLLAAPIAAPDDLAGSAGNPAQHALGAARAMGARFVVQGGVRDGVRDGGGATLAVLRLISAATGQVLWGGKQDAVEGEDPLPSLTGRLAELVLAELARAAGREAHRPGEPTEVTAPRRWVHQLILIGSVPGGPPEGKAIVLAPERTVIGRQAPSDVILPGGEVSRAHCQLDVADDVVTATDLGSTNGTFLNEDRIVASVRLGHGAALKVGPYLLRYLRHSAGQGADPEATVVSGS